MSHHNCYFLTFIFTIIYSALSIIYAHSFVGVCHLQPHSLLSTVMWLHNWTALYNVFSWELLPRTIKIASNFITHLRNFPGNYVINIELFNFSKDSTKELFTHEDFKTAYVLEPKLPSCPNSQLLYCVPYSALIETNLKYPLKVRHHNLVKVLNLPSSLRDATKILSR